MDNTGNNSSYDSWEDDDLSSSPTNNQENNVNFQLVSYNQEQEPSIINESETDSPETTPTGWEIDTNFEVDGYITENEPTKYEESDTPESNPYFDEVVVVESESTDDTIEQVILINNDESIVDDETELEQSTQFDQYSMLYQEDPNNPFLKCKIDPLDYETDDEENLSKVRIGITWNFEFNYDFYSIRHITATINKNNQFKTDLYDIKKNRNENNNITGDLFSISNDHNLKNGDTINLYFIVYYDNTKCNIKFYGLSNQLIDEDIAIHNIIREKYYGNKGKICYNLSDTNTDNGFNLIHKSIVL